MALSDRIESAIDLALARIAVPTAPARLASAMVYAVKPGGARIRPRICLSVARACAEDRPEVSDAASVAIELMHCASLVHDDLPCFDDAPLRRGKPTVHQAFGVPLAVLVGDALIVLAHATLAEAGRRDAARAGQLSLALASAAGMPSGICAGQGWESEPSVDVAAYHRAKTGALFVAATEMGAIAAGSEPEHWTELGARIGEAYQVADDLRDVLLDEAELGKPGGQDEANTRPSAVAELGVAGAVRHLQDVLAGAIASIPACPGEAELCAIVRAQADRLIPVAAARHLA